MILGRQQRQITIKSRREIEAMKVAGKLAARCLEEITNEARNKYGVQCG